MGPCPAFSGKKQKEMISTCTRLHEKQIHVNLKRKGEGVDVEGLEEGGARGKGDGRGGEGWGGSHTQHIYKAEEINI